MQIYSSSSSTTSEGGGGEVSSSALETAIRELGQEGIEKFLEALEEKNKENEVSEGDL